MILQFTINGTFVEIEESNVIVIEKLAVDDEFTSEFFRSAISQNNVPGFSPSDAEKYLHIERLFELGEDQEQSESEEENLIWIRKKPNTRDLEACELLLDLRLKYDDQFEGKVIPRNILWQAIAEELKKAGYPVGSGNGSERCRQKFSNLQKRYIRYNMGPGVSKPPLFYKKLHCILNKKFNFHPTFVEEESEDSKAGLKRLDSPCPSLSLEYDSEQSMEPKSELLWITKRPTRLDLEATDALLDLRIKYAYYFDEGKTTKQYVWQVIAEKLNAQGYFVGAKKEGAERCRQKFCNLQKVYNGYNAFCSIPGNSKKQPMFYSKIHSILGGSQKPSVPVESVPASEKIVITNINYFQDQLIETVRSMHENTMRIVIESNEKINELVEEQNILLSEQNEQRGKLINMFEEIVHSLNSLKRKRDDD